MSMTTREGDKAKSSFRLNEIELEGPEVANLLELEGTPLKRLCPLCKGEQEKAQRDREIVSQAEASDDVDVSNWAGKRVQIQDGPCYSLSINPKGFTCTSCGVYGDLVDLVRITRKCDDQEALLYLARHDGIRGGEASVDEALVFDEQVNTTHAYIYEAFLNHCRDVPTKALPVLRQWGITADDARKFKLLYRPRDYQRTITHLFDDFKVDHLVEAGILHDATGSEDSGDSHWFDLSKRGVFRVYHARQIPYVVIPYMLRGRPLYLKAQPLVSPARLQEIGVPYHLTTGSTVPCPFNADALRGCDRLVVTRGELDALGIAAAGYPAIGMGSFGSINRTWCKALAGKELIFILSERAQRDPRMPRVFEGLQRAGVTRTALRNMPSLDELMLLLRREFGAPTRESPSSTPPNQAEPSADEPPSLKRTPQDDQEPVLAELDSDEDMLQEEV